MKKILYFDASSGVSGDMFVAALIDAGADIEIIRNHIDSLGIDGFSIRARKVSKSGLMGTKFDVIDPETGRDVDAPEDNHHGHNHGHDHNGHGHDHNGHGHDHGHGQHLHNHGHEHGDHHDHHKNTRKKHHRSLWDIGSIICKSGLPQPVIDDAIAVFKLIAIAESKVHGLKCRPHQLCVALDWESVLRAVNRTAIAGAQEGDLGGTHGFTFVSRTNFSQFATSA